MRDASHDIGIDLGTTFSVVAVKGRVELAPGYPPGLYLEECDVTIIPTPEGDPTFPSVFWSDPADPAVILVGADARQKAIEGSAPVMFSKRAIGTNEPLPLHDRTYTARQVAAHILRHLKTCAERALGQPVRRAVVTHPAYFKPNQIQETHDAAVDAGFDMALPEQVMMEPAAAALAYTQGIEQDPLRVMTYDLGGGTFDVTVLERHRGLITMRAFDGDDLLGGYNFDRALMQWILEQVQAKGRQIPYDETNPEHRGRRARLLHLAETVKIKLSEARTPRQFIEIRAPDILVDTAGRTVQILERINQEQYLGLIHEHLEKTLRCCERALAKAGIAAADLDAILLVGGSCYGPWVQQAVAAKFGREVQLFRPDLCVAAGAAIRAAELPSVAAGHGIEIVLDLPPTSPLPRLTVGGLVRATGGAPLDADEARALRTLLETPSGVVLGPRKITPEHRFLFEEIDLLEDGPSDFVLRVITADGAPRLTRPFTVQYTPEGEGIDILNVLPKPIYIQTVNGLRAIAEEGVPLPARCEIRGHTVRRESRLVLELFMDDEPIGRVEVPDIPEDVGPGSPVLLTVEITQKNEMRGKVSILTRTGTVAREQPVQVKFPPLRVPEVSALQERFDELESRRQELETLSPDPEHRLLLAGRGLRLSTQLKRLFAEQMGRDRQEIYVKLKEFEKLVNPPAEDMHPPRTEFRRVLEECREQLKGHEGNAQLQPFLSLLMKIEADGDDAYRTKNHRKWDAANDSLRKVQGRVHQVLSPDTGGGGGGRPSSEPPPTWQLKDWGRAEVEQLRSYLQNRRAELERHPDYATRIRQVLDQAEHALDQMSDRIEKISEDLPPRQGSAAVQLALRERARVKKEIDQAHACVSLAPAGVGELQPKTVSCDPVCAPSALDRFRFSAFYPEQLTMGQTGRILASIHTEALAAQVVREAARRLDLPREVKIKAGSVSAAVTRRSVIKVTPDVSGLVFDVSEATLSLWEDSQSAEFRFQPCASSGGRSCRGWIHFWLEGVALADVPVTIFVVEEQVLGVFREALAMANAKPYRAVFSSYSHEDREIVDRMEIYARAFGDEYLRDVHTLRAGQQWTETLMRLIQQADVFQLFWSANAAVSPYVQQEWQYALQERSQRPDPHFVRPVYWTPEPAPIPNPLKALHFVRVPL